MRPGSPHSKKCDLRQAEHQYDSTPAQLESTALAHFGKKQSLNSKPHPQIQRRPGSLNSKKLHLPPLDRPYESMLDSLESNSEPTKNTAKTKRKSTQKSSQGQNARSIARRYQPAADQALFVSLHAQPAR
jgi:hypothetical protein